MIERRPRCDSSLSGYTSLVELIRQRALHRGEATAYQFLIDGQTPGESLTYRQLDDRTERIAAHLRRLGLRGERALLLYPPGHEFLLAFFGCLKAGVIAIPLPPPDSVRIKRSLPRLQSVIRDAQATLVLTTADIATLLRGCLDEWDEFHHLSWIDIDAIGTDHADDAGDADSWEPTVDDIALLQYTSGSTSSPKGVMVSHGNVLAQCGALKVAAGYDSRSVTCTWMPYHHDYGLIEGLIQPLFVGAPCYVLSPVSFIKRPHRWLEAISKYGVTHSQAPNFAYDLCVRKTTADQRSKLDLGRWRVAAVGAEPIRPSTLRAFYEAFKASGFRWQSFAPAYGLAEATLVVSHATPGDGPALLSADVRAYERGKLVEGDVGRTWEIASCGRKLDEMQVEIVHPETRLRCTEGEVGEIWVGGPSVTAGYWNRPEETAHTFEATLADTQEGPFLRTGDLGCIRQGELYVTGREKDLIILRGLNHYPQDIELTVEASHPAIRIGSGAAFSVSVDGEEQLAIVYEVQGKSIRDLDADSVMSSIREAIFNEHDLQAHAIALWKPGSVPKTTSGKIQRRSVKSAFVADDSNVVAKWQADSSAPRVLSGESSNFNADSSPDASSRRTHQKLRNWMVEWLADQSSTERSAIDPAMKFSDLGVDSLRAADFAEDLERLLDIRVDPTIFWRFGTIETLAEHLMGATDRASNTKTVVITPRESSQRVEADDVAIISMACRFPGGSASPEAYWQLLRDGGDAVSEIPASRWNVNDFFDSDREAAGKMYVRHGAFVDDVDRFDAAFFSLSPREAENLDPQQRLLLEVVWESLENAGIAPASLRGSDSGVFVGLSSDDYAATGRGPDRSVDTDAYKVMGTARSIAAGRIAYVLGWHGPVVQLDTACSSSLVSVYQACQSLRAGECQLAVAGGANLMLSPETMVALCKLTALAPDGRCKVFDADANGYVRGEGCGMVVLKRSSDALRDGDQILATIRAAAINHDGSSNGLTAPNGQAQERLIRSALQKASLVGSDVTYVEAHGTGTELGDPIELAALHAAYDEGRLPDEPLYVGSAKASIGHLEAAAGIAGLIKVVLMLQHREIPAQRNFRTPNPHVAWDQMSIRVPTERLSWPDDATDEQSGTAVVTRDLAAVSSFGFSGTNAHLILEGPIHARLAGARPNAAQSSTAEPPSSKPASAKPSAHLLTLSAQSETSLKALIKKYILHLESNPRQRIEDLCYSASTTRDHFKHRFAAVVSTRDELLATLRGFVLGDDMSRVVAGTCQTQGADEVLNVGFLFTGQGTQYAGMGRDLYQTQPVFRAAIDHCEDLLREHVDVPLTQLLYGQDSSDDCLLDQTRYTQPALLSLQYALVELWKSWGIIPGAVIGHSSGEYAAAWTAGVMDLNVALQLVAARGRLIDDLPHAGTMAVVMASEARVQAVIDSHGGRVAIAAVNAPEIIVISGENVAVDRVIQELIAVGVDVEKLKTSNAGHSALIEPMLEPYGGVASSFTYASPCIPLVSNVSGDVAGDEVACADYWVDHVRQPVRFADGMKALATHCRTFVEIGPNPNLLAMGMAALRGLRPRPKWLPSLAKDQDGWESMLFSLAQLYVHGADIDWDGFHRPYKRNRVALPTYAFDHHRFPLRRSAQPIPDTGNRQLRSTLPDPHPIATALNPRREGLEDEARELTVRLDEVAIQFVVDALRELGFPWSLNVEIPDSQLASQVPAENRPKVNRVLKRLADRGLLRREANLYRVASAVPTRDAEALLDLLQPESDYPERRLMRRAGRSLAAIWKGDVEPLSVLFPNGATDEALDFYRHAHLFAKYNELAGDVVAEVVSRIPSGSNLRVLEVGAGTGGLTSFLIPRIPTQGSQYVFTDLSPLFLHAAQERFQQFPFLRTQLLDIGQSPESQGFESGSFDLVVAANVLHATPRLKQTLRHVQQLLKTGGWLMLLEGANPPLWGDMVFTLIDGWWSFEDTDLRPDYPLMRCDRWATLLKECGFDRVESLNDATHQENSYNTLYLANSGMGVSSLAVSSPGIAEPASTVVDSVSSTTAVPVVPGDEDAKLQDTLIDVFDWERLTGLVRDHAARVMRLKSADIELTQPLSELGLDSLMATELRARLGNSFGKELSLNTLQMRRSIEEIAAYIYEDQVLQDSSEPSSSESGLAGLEVDAPRAHLIPLQPTGAKTPLFFVPAGYGDLFAFQQISHAIGMNQPVYGLQPASAKRVKTFRQMSIYRLVSAYIAEIKKVQSEGPYYLSGYSAGAIIAVELARELMRQGDKIGLLVIFDPPSHVPFWLDSFYEVNYRVTSATGLIDLVSRLRSRFARRMFHAILDEGLRTHTSVTRGHRVAPYPGRITHFRASVSQSSLVSMKPVGRFWRRTAQSGVEVHWIPGTHYGMLRGSGASVVVDELRDCLQRAKASHGHETNDPKGESP